MTITEPTSASPLLSSPLVSTQWLADHLGSEGLVVLDASVLPVPAPEAGSSPWASGREGYLREGHVPGALFADLILAFSDADAPQDFTRPTVAQFEAAAAAIGIGNESAVVVYDTAAGQWAARIWWLFRAFGHERVAVLNGGFAKWVAEERPIEAGAVDAKEAVFVAVERPEFWVDKAYVESVVAGETDAALVYSGRAEDFTGPTLRPRDGHIPGSLSVPASTLLDPARSTLLKGEALRSRLQPILARSNRVVTYCGSGIAAASTALALTIAGETDVAVYDGSLNEWSADPEAPLDL